MFYGDYTDCPHSPLYSFGHGLGYSTFEYFNMTVAGSDTSTPVTVEVTVANTGQREGETVVQLYVSDLVASVARPAAALVGFARVDLAAGRQARVTFHVHPSRLAFYDEQMRFVVEPGEFRLAIGASSSDIRQESIVELAGPLQLYSQRSVIPVRAEISALDEAQALNALRG